MNAEIKQPTSRVTISLTSQQIAIALGLGGGNISVGIRKALQREHQRAIDNASKYVVSQCTDKA